MEVEFLEEQRDSLDVLDGGISAWVRHQGQSSLEVQKALVQSPVEGLGAREKETSHDA